MEWLVVWGVANAGGFIFKDVFLPLVKGALEDYTKDFFKDRISSVVEFAHQKPLKKALGQALKEFLSLVQDELLAWGLSEQEIRSRYGRKIENFMYNDAVKSVLRKAFEPGCKSIDARILEETWHQLDLPELPEEFDWNQIAKQYLRKVKAILRESEELRVILDSHHLEAIRNNTEAISGIIPDFDMARYRECIREFYGCLRLDILHASGYEYRVQLWRMFIPQNVREGLPLHDIPKDDQRSLGDSQPNAELSAEERERYKQVYYQKPLYSVLEIIDDLGYKFMVILGDPGSGKSTLTQYIMLNWAEKPNSVIPLLIELRKYAIDRNLPKDFLEFFHQGSGAICRLNQQRLHEKLKAGEAFVMFDGLDEIFEINTRNTIVTEIIRFTNEYPDVRVVVTSRIIGYVAQPFRDAQFTHFTLQDLDSDRIRDFINRWYDLAFGNHPDKDRLQKRLQAAIKNSSAIRQLAENPLLLTMMAILNRNQELPRDRAELYDQASRVLLHEWDIERGLPVNEKLAPDTIGRQEKQAMLRKVAYQMQASDKGLGGNLIRAGNLEEIIANYLETLKEIDKPRTVARLIIEQLRSRNFILCFYGGDYYAFVHRTFLEYFCAWEFVWQFKEKQTLSIENLKTEVFGQHWNEESWHEVLRLIVGKIDASFAGQIIEYLMELDGEEEEYKNLFLAAKCLSELRNRFDIQATSQRLLDRLKWLVECDGIDSNRINAVKAIAATWRDESATLSWLKALVYSREDITIRSQAVQEIAQGWKDSPETLSWLKVLLQSNENEQVRGAAVEQIAQGWENERETLPLLKTLIQPHEESAVRRAAARGLSRCEKDSPEILSLLKTIAKSYDDNNLRSDAVWGIGQRKNKEPETLSFLRNLARADEAVRVRDAAVRELAKSWKNDPETLPLFKSLIQSDEHQGLRDITVEQLAQGWKNDLDTLPLLKSLIWSDEHRWIRRAAVEQLAQGWKNDPETLPLLKSLIWSDESQFPRMTAVSELVKGWKNDPDTLPFLKSFIQSDKHQRVRSFAVRELARGWKNDSDILLFLKSLIQSDEHQQLRNATVQGLAQGWKSDPETLPLLKSAIQLDEESPNDDYYDNNFSFSSVEQLAQGWKNDPETLPLLKVLVQSHRNKWIRMAAVRALAQHWASDPETLPLLKNCAQFDSDGYWVRRSAIWELVRHWKNDPETVMILKTSAREDDNWYVRRTAIAKLAKGWKGDRELLAIFKTRAELDEDWCVRREAIEALGCNWTDEPGMFEFLRDRALSDPFDLAERREDYIFINPRLEALAALFKQSPDREEILGLLRDRADNDPDPTVRKFARLWYSS